jgi:hypothetical protein
LNTLRNSLTSAQLRIGLVVAGLAALSLPATASGGGPTDQQYSSSLEFISQGGDPGSTGSAPGGLPFTGLDVALLAAVAVGLLIAGFMLRRQRPKESLKG